MKLVERLPPTMHDKSDEFSVYDAHTRRCCGGAAAVVSTPLRHWCSDIAAAAAADVVVEERQCALIECLVGGAHRVDGEAEIGCSRDAS